MKLTLKQWRLIREMSRKDLATKIGKNQQTIYNWETGISIPNAKDMSKLMQALQADFEDIILP